MWIESHLELRHHPKTRRLGEILKISRPAVIGHLHLLWYWCSTYSPSGNLTKYTVDEIAEGSDWKGNPGAFVDGLVESGFLDRTRSRLRVHDWNDFAGKYFNRRRSRGKPAPVRTTKRLELLRAMPYKEYLETPEWHAVRKRALATANRRCQLCNALGPLHVHHRSYDRRGAEQLDDLTVLCADCHAKFHGADPASTSGGHR